MPAVYQIKFLPGGETEELYGSRGDHYELAKGTHIDLRSTPVWCHQCDGFTDGESIEALEEIERRKTERARKNQLQAIRADTIGPAHRLPFDSEVDSFRPARRSSPATRS